MGTEIIAPKRADVIIQEDRSATLRFNRFLVLIRNWISDAPDVAAAVADVSTGSADPDIIALEDKINELMASLRTAGVMDT